MWGDRDSSVGIATRYGLGGPGSNPCGGDIFQTRPDRPRGPLTILYNAYRLSYPEGGMRQGHGVDHPLLYSTKVKEKVYLYLHLSYIPSWQCTRRALPSSVTYMIFVLNFRKRRGKQNIGNRCIIGCVSNSSVNRYFLPRRKK